MAVRFRRARIVIAACAAAWLAGCVSPPAPVEPDAAVPILGELRAGTLVLSCGPACRDTWNRELAAISSLDRAERWSDLTLRLVRIGYGSDLAYEYLGQAAEGMGYHRAAAVFFTQARALADSSDVSMQCGGGLAKDRCDGIRVAETAGLQAAASRDALLRETAGSELPQRPARFRLAKSRAIATAAPVPPRAARPQEAVPRPVSGLAQAIDTATLQVRGRTIALAGITGRPDSYAAQLQALIDAHGNSVHCVAAGAAYACTLRNGLDVAGAALASGLATVTDDAPEALRTQQQAARAARRGLWRAAPGDSG